MIIHLVLPAHSLPCSHSQHLVGGYGVSSVILALVSLALTQQQQQHQEGGLLEIQSPDPSHSYYVGPAFTRWFIRTCMCFIRTLKFGTWCFRGRLSTWIGKDCRPWSWRSGSGGRTSIILSQGQEVYSSSTGKKTLI